MRSMLEYLRPGPSRGVVWPASETPRRTVINIAGYVCLIICVIGVEGFHFVKVVSALAFRFTRVRASSNFDVSLMLTLMFGEVRFILETPGYKQRGHKWDIAPLRELAHRRRVDGEWWQERTPKGFAELPECRDRAREARRLCTEPKS